MSELKLIVQANKQTYVFSDTGYWNDNFFILYMMPLAFWDGIGITLNHINLPSGDHLPEYEGLKILVTTKLMRHFNKALINVDYLLFRSQARVFRLKLFMFSRYWI